MPVTNYVWDELSDNMLMETDELGATKAEYTNEPDEFGGLISQRRGGTTSYYHFDGQGSTRALTDSTETVTDTNIYDAWGVNVSTSGTTENPFRYAGEFGYYFDVELESHSVRRRRYEATIARWASVDPRRFVDGPNQYLYVENHPTNAVDPSGLLSQSTVIIPVINVPLALAADCGVYFWQTQWNLGSKEKNGLIIQEVNNTGRPEKCPPLKGAPTPKVNVSCVNPTLCDKYYEVWRVKDGTIYGGKMTFSAVPMTPFPFDVFALVGFKEKTKGNLTKTGDAFFVSADDIAMETMAERAVLKNIFKHASSGAAAGACRLRATCIGTGMLYGKTIEQWFAFWQTKRKTPTTKKTAVRKWDCCECAEEEVDYNIQNAP